MTLVISMIICTRNRAAQLRRVLESASRMIVPSTIEWELIIVDNGSTDATPAVVEQFRERLPIRRVEQPVAGLSNARNAGVGEARGDYICWTDDDVVLSANWLAAYANAFATHPDATLFGGPVRPVFEGTPPKWLTQGRNLLAGLLAERPIEIGGQIVATSPERLPFGANFAIRAKEQRLQLYDPELGVSPAFRRLGEETAVMLAVLKPGVSGCWVPNARLDHIIPEHRQTMAYVATYFQSVGETSAMLSSSGRRDFIGDPDSPRGALEDRYRQLRHYVLHLVRWVTGSVHTSIYHWTKYNYLVGRSRYLRNLDHSRPRATEDGSSRSRA